MKTLFFISENKNKFDELESYLSKSKFHEQFELKLVIPSVEIYEIQSNNRFEVVERKLHDAMKLCNEDEIKLDVDESGDSWYIMVEDTSFSIDKLGGFPGTFIKYYLKCQTLDEIADANLDSDAYAFVNLAVGRSTCKCSFESVIKGKITTPRGLNGFGYDPIFKVYGTDKTNAELSMDEKALYNPRTLVFQQVLEYLSNV
jgi:non-canonical purine NTP pyrophosphatase (RdgB/HAM1 family)